MPRINQPYLSIHGGFPFGSDCGSPPVEGRGEQMEQYCLKHLWDPLGEVAVKEQ